MRRRLSFQALQTGDCGLVVILNDGDRLECHTEKIPLKSTPPTPL